MCILYAYPSLCFFAYIYNVCVCMFLISYKAI